MKVLIFFTFEVGIYIYLSLAAGYGKDFWAGLAIAYFFLWTAIHRREIKRLQGTIGRLVAVQLDHNDKMIKIGREALDEKK